MTKYDDIGVDYDETRRPDPYILQRLYHHLRFSEEGRYLDIARGTGNYTLALSSMGNAQFFGIDVSEQMIGAARGKGHSVLWCRGDVGLLPFKSGIFSGAICTLAIHHFSRFYMKGVGKCMN